ncbi:MAG: ABC transporter ATP-binding protein/permease [Cellulomonadaceae bacterium]|jgi:ATP-binding cassette subfamily B protein|nr:ABC transporter ATP-binding protein/permease [Cellulomonadaceae bacterium]
MPSTISDQTPAVSAPVPAVAEPKQPKERSSFRTLMGYIWPHRGKVGLGALMGIIATVANLWFPRLTQYVIDALATGHSTTGYIWAAIAVTATGLLAMLAQFIILGYAGERVVFDVRAAVIQRILHGHVPTVLSKNSGDLISRATADAPLITHSVAWGLVGFITAITGVIGSIVFMGSIDGTMLGITLACLVVLVALMAVLMPRVGRKRAQAQEAIGELGGALEGSVASLRTIKALGAEKARADKALESAAQARKFNVSAMISENLSFEVGLGGMLIVTVAMLAVGANRVQEGTLSIAALVAFIMYTQNFLGPLMEIADGLGTIQNGLAAAKRVAELEDIPLESTAAPAVPASAAPGVPASAVPAAGHLTSAAPASGDIADPATNDVPVIELRNVTATYHPREGDVLSDVSLSIPRRGHVALVGPSGAGKTSMMSLLLHFLAPRKGQVLLDGVDCETLTLAEIRSRFAYVEQVPTVLPGTVRDNLVIAKPEATDQELMDVLSRVHLDTAVSGLEFGLDEPIVAATMTGGSRQRIALARALLRNPDVLLLDEPTSQVTGVTEDAIHEVIAATAQHHAVVTIAHRAETVEHADQIIVMEQGTVRTQGTHTELLGRDALYREMMSHLRLNDGE